MQQSIIENHVFKTPIFQNSTHWVEVLAFWNTEMWSDIWGHYAKIYCHHIYDQFHDNWGSWKILIHDTVNFISPIIKSQYWNSDIQI